MSIKIYDEKSGKYVTAASNWASGIKVLDTEGNFIDEDGKPSESVEQALKELAHKQRVLSERVEYIYENGTLVGGGEGVPAIPTITLLSPVSETPSQQYATMEIPTSQEVTIQYSFQSPNIGNGTVYYIITGDVETRIQATISQGINSYNFGNFATGAYAINIYVIDAGGMYSNTASVAIRSGSLEITSDFKETTDFTLMDEIEIRYSVSTVSREPIVIHMSVDGKESTREVESSGTYVWNAGLMSYTGIHELSLYATSGDYSSNTLTYKIIVGDTTSMFISSNFTETSIQEGRQIAIPYRVSMAGETRALVYKWINNIEQPVDTVTLGTGNYIFWNIGDQLTAGDYEFKIQATTLDGAILSNILTFDVEVAAEAFARIRAVVDDSLMASFIADNKSSLASNRNVWEDDSDNNVSCQLYNFNHATNGWDGYSLNFDGRAYAVIDLQPWIRNCPYGFTFDIYYKVENIGNINAKVLWMKNNNTPYQGFYIDTQRANITSGAGRTIETIMRDSDSKQTNWQHVTFTVNRETRLMEIFVNGVISQAVRLNASEAFEFDGKIYLGGQFNSNTSTISEQGKMSVRAIHIYDRVLTDDEIVNNFIACLPYPAEQERVYRLNYDDQQIPRMDITGNLDNMTDDDTNTPLVGITYVDYADLTKSFELNQCKISIQGTSSQLYPVKNYTIQLRANGQDFYYAPKDAWKPFPRFTLKANYIDSSSANNIANARFFNDLISAYHPYPSQQIDGQCRGTVDGFPIRLYINDEYQGLYTFNIDRYAYNAYGFDLGGQTVAYEVAANTNTGAGAFFEQENDNATWNSIKQEFEYRYHYAGDEKIVCEVDATLGNQTVLKQGSYHTDLVDLVKWTSSATDEDFTGEIENHWSLNHLIDYFLTVYVVGLVDNFGKNMVIANFGKDVNMNVVWYVMMYDADKEIVCPHGDMSEKTFSNRLGSLEIDNKAEVNYIGNMLTP